MLYESRHGLPILASYPLCTRQRILNNNNKTSQHEHHKKNMKTTKSLSFREFELIYKDNKCPLCERTLGSRNPYFDHKNPAKNSACPRIRELIPFLKGIKEGFLAGESVERLR